MKRKTNDSSLQQGAGNQNNLITSLINTAVDQTDGIAGDVKEGNSRKKASRNIRLTVNDNEITVNVSVNVIFGFNVPTVACELQEKIIRNIQENTSLTVKAVNVHVSNAIFL